MVVLLTSLLQCTAVVMALSYEEVKASGLAQKMVCGLAVHHIALVRLHDCVKVGL